MSEILSYTPFSNESCPEWRVWHISFVIFHSSKVNAYNCCAVKDEWCGNLKLLCFTLCCWKKKQWLRVFTEAQDAGPTSFSWSCCAVERWAVNRQIKAHPSGQALVDVTLAILLRVTQNYPKGGRERSALFKGVEAKWDTKERVTQWIPVTELYRRKEWTELEGSTSEAFRPQNQRKWWVHAYS